MKIVKLSVILLAAILFSACTAPKSAKTQGVEASKKVRFQSVPEAKAILLQKGEKRESCAICGMHLPTFYRTNHAAHTGHGTSQYCSLHCLVYDNEINKTDLSNVRVVDTDTLKFIPALDAWYVVGSSKPATMSNVSKYAFATRKRAEAFAKKYGGKVVRFYDAYDVAIEDFVKKR